MADYIPLYCQAAKYFADMPYLFRVSFKHKLNHSGRFFHLILKNKKI